jgi:catechol 2,3-dioxygenase-like lactoylglutathione lyase family enzyme
MQVNSLDHVNIRTRDLDASAKFYSDVLGLRMGDPPSMVSRDRARWLYDKGDRPIIHLQRYDSEPCPTGSIDHIAMRCTGKADLLERLKSTGAAYDIFELSPTWTVINTRDPHGVVLELNFSEE